MEKAEIRALLDEVKAEVPAITRLNVTYYGCGDSFGDYSGYSAYNKDDVEIEIPEKFFLRINEIFDEVIDNQGILFDGDGAEGEITINFLSYEIEITNYLLRMDKHHDFDQTIFLL